MSTPSTNTRLPEGFQATAQTDSTPFAGLADPGRGLYGIQFHPEVVHTPRGRDILRNFVVGIAGVPQTWTAANFIDTTVNGIGDFTCGGPRGDNGLSGKKLVVDHYGPQVPIGGGALCSSAVAVSVA